jgi:hypothetical protein
MSELVAAPPFVRRSFREFMLGEAHALRAARGYARQGLARQAADRALP